MVFIGREVSCLYVQIILIKVFLCVKDFGVIKEMMEYENESGKIKIVGISTTVLEDMEELEHMEVDMLVLQFAIDYQKAGRLFEYLLMNHQASMNVLPLFQELDSEVIHLLLQYDLQNFLVQPFTFSQLISAIESQQFHHQTSVAAANTIESSASEIMLELGLPAHLDGFRYIQSAAIYIAKNVPTIRFNLKNVYQETAKQHRSTSLRVEKCIRTAIGFAYRNQPERICVNNCKPTNRQIIVYISERLKLFSI